MRDQKLPGTEGQVDFPLWPDEPSPSSMRVLTNACRQAAAFDAAWLKLLETHLRNAFEWSREPRVPAVITPKGNMFRC